MELFVFASPIYSNKFQVCKVRAILCIVLHRRDNMSIRLREEHAGLWDRNLPWWSIGRIQEIRQNAGMKTCIRQCGRVLPALTGGLEN